MVAAKKRLLNVVRRLAIRDELLAMRLRSRLIVPQAQPPSGESDLTARSNPVRDAAALVRPVGPLRFTIAR